MAGFEQKNLMFNKPRSNTIESFDSKGHRVFKEKFKIHVLFEQILKASEITGKIERG